MEVKLGPTGLISALGASGAEAVRAGASVLNAQIQSQTKLKFGLYALASVFLIVAALLVVFAPDGRQTISSIVAVALFVVAVGCAGFGAFAIKTPFVAAEAGMDTSRPASHVTIAQETNTPRRPRRPPA
jgi:hypothetical protein